MALIELIIGKGGSMPTAARDIPEPPAAGRRQDLQISKKRGGKPIPFSRLNKGTNADQLNDEEFVSGINWHAHKQADDKAAAIEAAQPKTIEDVPLRDYLKRADNICSRCREVIAGKDRRHIVLTFNVPSVGADSSGFSADTVCASCFTPTTAAAPTPGGTANDWRSLLKPQQRRVWAYFEAGKSTLEIIAATNLSQSQVSRTLAACKKIRDGAHA